MATTPRFRFPTRLMSRPGSLALLALVPAVGGAIVMAGDVAARSTVTGAALAVPVPADDPAMTGTLARASGPAAGPRVQVAATSPGAAAPGTAPANASGGAAAASPGGPLMASRAHRGSVGCLIGPERTADIGSAVTGVVARIAVDRGDRVRAGQTLLALEQEVERSNVQVAQARSSQEAEVRSAESQLALARDRHQRLLALRDSGAVPQLNIEQARAEAEVAEQRLEQARGQRRVQAQELAVAQAQLAQRTLRAPFEGVIVERMAHEGERVEDRPLLRLAQLDPLRVELVMPAQRWNSVKAGDLLPVLPELPGAERALARVTHVDHMLDAASNTFRVRLALANPGHRIPAGARCKLDAPADAAAGAPANGSGSGSGSASSPAGSAQLPATTPAPGVPAAPSIRPAAYVPRADSPWQSPTPRLRFSI